MSCPHFSVTAFLGAYKHLSKRVCLSIRRYFHPSVRRSLRNALLKTRSECAPVARCACLYPNVLALALSSHSHVSNLRDSLKNPYKSYLLITLFQATFGHALQSGREWIRTCQSINQSIGTWQDGVPFGNAGTKMKWWINLTFHFSSLELLVTWPPQSPSCGIVAAVLLVVFSRSALTSKCCYGFALTLWLLSL